MANIISLWHYIDIYKVIRLGSYFDQSITSSDVSKILRKFAKPKKEGKNK